MSGIGESLGEHKFGWELLELHEEQKKKTLKKVRQIKRNMKLAPATGISPNSRTIILIACVAVHGYRIRAVTKGIAIGLAKHHSRQGGMQKATHVLFGSMLEVK
jgi:hypothetical protein